MSTTRPKRPLYMQEDLTGTLWLSKDDVVYEILDVREPGHPANRGNSLYVLFVARGAEAFERDWKPMQCVTRDYERLM